MTHRTLARLKEHAKHLRSVSRLDRERRKLGITNADIAAACKPPVGKSLVVHFFAGRSKSKNVMDATQRLIAERMQHPSVI